MPAVFVISIDNDLITEKQLVPRKGITERKRKLIGVY